MFKETILAEDMKPVQAKKLLSIADRVVMAVYMPGNTNGCYTFLPINKKQAIQLIDDGFMPSGHYHEEDTTIALHFSVKEDY